MLGWNIGVFKQRDDGASPATAESQHGTRLAVWQTGLGGRDWLEELVRAGKAINLGGNGYPCRYTATAEKRNTANLRDGDASRSASRLGIQQE